MSICTFCNGTKVEPGHTDCVWCDNTGVLALGENAQEVVLPNQVELMNTITRLKAENQALQDRLTATDAENDRLRTGLKFYADKDHFSEDMCGDFDTVSGEPANILWHESECWFVEDGSIARHALEGKTDGQLIP